MGILMEIIYFSTSLSKELKGSLFLELTEFLCMYFFPLESNGNAADMQCSSQFEQEFSFQK